MDLPTYTSIWRIEKRLYKLYDFRLPMPVPVGQIAVFAAITVPYVIILTVLGLPFSHTLFWLYVLPPGVLTWLATRPVLESKRLPELVISQVRYLGEPATWCRMNPLAEKDEIVVVGRVWRRTEEEKPAEAPAPVPARRPTPVRARPAPAAVPARAATPRRAATTQAAAQAAARAVAPARPVARPGQTGRPMPARPVAPSRVPGLPRIPVTGQQVPAQAAGLPSAQLSRPVAFGQPAEPAVQPGWGAPAGADAPNGANTPAVTPSAPAAQPVSLARPVPVTEHQPVPVAEQGLPLAPPAQARPDSPVATPGHAAPGHAAPARPPRWPGTADQPGLLVPPPPVVPAARPAPAEHSEPPKLPGPSRPASLADPASPARAPGSPAWPASPAQPSGPVGEPGPVRPEPPAGQPAPASPVAHPASASAEAAPTPRTGPPEIAHDERRAPPPRPAAHTPAEAVAQTPTEPVPQAQSEAVPSLPAEAVAYGLAEAAAAHAPSEAAAPVSAEAAAQAAAEPVPHVPAQTPAQAAPFATPEASLDPPEAPPAAPAERPQPAEPAGYTEPAEPVAPPAEPALPSSPIVVVRGGTGTRPAAVERALGAPGQQRAGTSWREHVRVVPGGHGPGRPDMERRDRARVLLPIRGPRLIVVLGCTVGAGQTVTALMLADVLASLRTEPVAALDLNPGQTSLTELAGTSPAATARGLLAGQQPAGSQNSGPRNPGQLDLIAHDSVAAGRPDLSDAEYARLIRILAGRYPLTLTDPGATAVARVLAAADQLVLVAPASADAAQAVTMTMEWLDGHGYGDLVTNAIAVINGVSKRSMAHVEQAELVVRGRCRATVRVPWDDHLGAPRDEQIAAAPGGPGAGDASRFGQLRPPVQHAYTALAGVLVSALAVEAARPHGAAT